MDDTANSSQVMFSRSTGLPPEMGKATSELKCKLPDCVKEDFARKSRSRGLLESEYLRELVMLDLYGFDKVLSMHAQRLRLVAGKSSECGTTEGA